MKQHIEESEALIQVAMEKLEADRLGFARRPVEDFVFESEVGPVRLSELFGEHDDLVIIHNMGGSCRYCTLWADGFSGYLRHIEERTSFVVVSPDSPEAQRKLAQARGWSFRMVQDAEQRFSQELGMLVEGGWWPGASGYHREADGQITLTGLRTFGPGDQFCLVWPLFELLDGGPKGWEPH